MCSNIDGCKDYQAKYQMISLICGIYNMTQMFVLCNKQTHSHREQICVCQGEGVGEGWIETVGLVDANDYIQNG